MYSHAHPLVPDVVALAEVVGAAGPREGYCRQDRDSPDLLPVGREIREALGSLGDDACPGRQIGGYEYCQCDEGQNNNDQHSLDPLEQLIDYWREGDRQGDTNKEYHGDDGKGTLPEAEDVCEQLRRARGPAWEGVRQDRPEHEEHGPAYPHAAKARDGGLASGQRVAFDLHVQEELHAYAEHGEPHEG